MSGRPTKTYRSMHTDTMIRYIIIDDHPDIRDGIQSFISKNSAFELLQAFEDVRTALTAPLNAAVDVIILDLNLRNVDAIKFVPDLKRRFPTARIIAYTQYDDRQRELRTAGVNGYLLKTERQNLIEAMQTVMAGQLYYKTIAPTPANDNGNVYADLLEKFRSLTPRQREVAELIHHHLTNREIGERLFTSEDTVKSHRKAINQKLAPKSREDFYSMLRTYFELLGNTNWPGGLPEPPKKA